MNLYQIAGDIKALLGRVEDGEIDDTLAGHLDALEGEFAAKAELIVKAVRNLEASAKAKSEEATRLRESADADRWRAEWLEEYLKGRMELLGLGKLDAGLFTVRVVANSAPSVTVDADPKDLPDEFTRVKVEANKIALGRAWKAGVPLPDGVKVEQGTHLRYG